MQRILLSMLAALLLASCASDSVEERRPLNVVVLGSLDTSLGDDRDRAVYRRLVNGMQGAIADAGHQVIDASLATMDDFELGARASESALLDAARSLGSRIDAAVIFDFTVSQRGRSASQEVRGVLSARAMQPASGRLIANASRSMSVRISPSCQGRCLADRLGREARSLGAEIGAVIAASLDGRPAPAGSPAASAFEISLDGFLAWEAGEIENTLADLDGYKDHRIQYSSSRRLDFWYETADSASRIRRQLEATFDRLGIRANVQFSGNTFMVNKISLRPSPAPDDSDWEW